MCKRPSISTRLRLLAAALALPSLLVALPAVANVRTTISGAACYPDPYWARQGGSFDVAPNGEAMWHNASTDASFAFSMICPLSRSLPLSTDGMSDFEIRFRSTTSQPSSAICQVASVRPDGTVLLSDIRNHNMPGGTATTMDFNAAINKSANKGTYAMYCTLPLTVALVSVYHSEVDGVSGN